MKIVFAGTPVFSQQAYQAILEAGFEVSAIMTQPKQYALEQETVPEIIQTPSLRLDGRYPEEAKIAYDTLMRLQPDVIVVVAYGLLLPQWILDLPKHGCLNIHASLLPRWRGAAPIQRAIEAQDKETGIGIMQMTLGLDEGDVLLEKRCDIGQKNTVQLHDELAVLGAQGIVEVLKTLDSGMPLNPVPQATEGMCYAHKIEKSEAVLDMHLSADVLAAKVRAFNPFPGANCQLPWFDERIKIWHAIALMDKESLKKSTEFEAGKVVSYSQEGIDIATGHGLLRLLELQKPGSKRQSVDIFVQGINPS